MTKSTETDDLLARAEQEAERLLADLKAMRNATGRDLTGLVREVRLRADAIKTLAVQMNSEPRRQWRPAGSPGDAEKRDMLRRGAFRIITGAQGHD